MQRKMEKQQMRKNAWEILGVDHVAITVKNIDAWEAVYVTLFGGTRFYRIEDANPEGSSSMKLCGIKIGGLSIALIEGIDRTEKSQVTRYVELHGDHSFQHVAIAVRGIETFLHDLCERGVSLLGDLKQREDTTWGGQVKQIFALPFDAALDSDQAPFFEFVERPTKGETFIAADSFSDDFAKDLYKDVEAGAACSAKRSFISAEAVSRLLRHAEQ